MRHLVASIVLFVASLVLVGCDSKPDDGDVVLVQTKDSEMVVAIQHARETLDSFLALASHPPANASDFKLKVMIKDGANTEHFWITPFHAEGDAFVGTLANQPKVVRGVTLGQTVNFSRADISDWGLHC